MWARRRKWLRGLENTTADSLHRRDGWPQCEQLVIAVASAMRKANLLKRPREADLAGPIPAQPPDCRWEQVSRALLNSFLLNLVMQCASRWQRRLKADLFSGDRVVEFQILRVQEISSVAGESGEIFERLAR